MKDILSTVVAVAGVGTFVILPAAVALMRSETDRTGSEGTIPHPDDDLAAALMRHPSTEAGRQCIAGRADRSNGGNGGGK